MARARQIKPGFLKNEVLADLGPYAMLLFEGLWMIADREGKLEDRPRRIKAEALPYFDVNVDELLDKLASKGFIVRYVDQNDEFIKVVKFTEHQNPHRDEKPSQILDPEQLPNCTVKAPCLHSINPGKNGVPEVQGTSKELLEDFKENKVAEISELPNLMRETAKRIYDRHPANRRCSVSAIQKNLGSIVRQSRGDEAKIEKLREVDENHRGWCESEEWQKDDGQYVKGLENWLAPTKFRYEVVPEIRPPSKFGTPKPSRMELMKEKALKLARGERDGTHD